MKRLVLQKTYLTSDLKAEIALAAAREGESVSAWIRRVLRAAIARRQKADR